MKTGRTGGGDANPVLVEVWRGEAIESIHRGSWALCDDEGREIDGAGDRDGAIFPRSAIKALQALPLVESGAADRFSFDDGDLALACASHDGEPCHVERAASMLARAGLAPSDLRCGAHAPSGADAAAALRARGEAPSALHNNCSGKHAGFLALARHLDAPAATYLEPDSAGQRLVRRAVAETCGVDPAALEHGVDGCSAPNWRLPLAALATGFARVASPDSGALAAERAAACRRLVGAVAAHPVLLGGSRGRLCTDLVRASGGRIFPKIGAEGVYALGVRDRGLGLALKIDDGGRRGLHAALVGLLERLALATEEELERLAPWRGRELRNHSGLVVGRLEVRA